MKTGRRLFQNFLTSAISAASVSVLSLRLALDISLAVIIPASVAAVLLIWVFDINKKRKLTYFIIAGALLFACLFLLFGNIPVNTFFNQAGAFISSAFIWLQFWLSVNNAQYSFSFALTIVLLSLSLLSLIVYILGKRLITRLALSALLLAAMVGLSILGIDIGGVAVTIFLIQISTSVVELSNRVYNPGRQGVSLSIFPLCIAAAALVVLLPSKAEPIKWQLVRGAISGISEKLTDLSYNLRYELGLFSDDFVVSFTGYSEGEGKLGGDISSVNEVLLRADTERITRSPVYFRGTVSNVYSGRSWKRKKIPNVTGLDEYQTELYETLYSLSRSGVTPKEDEYFYSLSDMTLTFDTLVTKSLFYPNGLYGLASANSKDTFDAADTDVRFYKLKRSGTAYRLKFLMLDSGSDTLTNYLRSLEGYSYASSPPSSGDDGVFGSLSTSVNVSRAVFSENFHESLAIRAETIRNNYLSLPDSVPQRVYDLAEQITVGCDTDYDKLKAIEAYLSAFTYTQTPGDIPSGRDFVDYFLFESKKGYCTYFATAMAVLGRCVGVPTRYVEGLLLNYDDWDGEAYLVTSGDSHAWAEAYIEGFGWIELEASPGYYDGKYKPWAKKIVSSAPGKAEGTSNGTESIIKPEEIEPTPEPEAEMPPETESAPYLLYLGAFAALILLIILLYLSFVHAYSRRKYYKATKNEKIWLLTADILRCLSLTGKKLVQGETISEFTSRIGTGYEGLQSALTIFIRVRYAGYQARDVDVRALADFRNELRKQVAEQVGRLRLISLSFGPQSLPKF